MNKNSVAMELKCISNLCMRYMDNHSHKKDIDSITGTNSWIIGYLSTRQGEDVFQRDLEKRFSITRSTASKVINLMVTKGLIERQSVPHDARLKKLILTKKAESLATLMQDDGKKLDEILTQDLTDTEVTIFLNCINKMKENLKNHL